MTPEQITALLAGLAGVLVALGSVFHNISELRKDINGRMSQLLEEHSAAARKEGELAGRDYAIKRRRTEPTRSTVRRRKSRPPK